MGKIWPPWRGLLTVQEQKGRVERASRSYGQVNVSLQRACWGRKVSEGTKMGQNPRHKGILQPMLCLGKCGKESYGQGQGKKGL